MPITRRTALTVFALGVTGCAGSPVIVGDPATAPTVTTPPPPPEPTRSAAAEAAHVTLAQMHALLDALLQSPHWEAHDWTVAALAQCEAHLARLEVEEPLSSAEQEAVFEVQIGAAHQPSDSIVAANRLNSYVADCTAALEVAAADAGTSALRLLYTSMSTAVLGLHDQSVPPIEGDGAPRGLQDTTVEASLPVLLGHVWALIYGLGAGLGRIAKSDPLHAIGTARLDAARALRNELRAELDDVALEQPAAFELPNEMDSAEAVRAAWGVLESRVLESYARLVAADPDPRWRIAMRDQVPPVQATGTALTWWPGWLA